jgi:hypothetical protein
MPSSKSLPSQETLLRLFRYDAQTGRLYHQSGAEAFTTADRRGYRHGSVSGTNYQAHRVIWKMVHGVDPDTIDHINGDQGDNRLDNLRDCSNAENSRNYRKPAGSSQYRGVCWVKRDRAWAARISDGQGGKVSLGNHTEELSAALAYDAAARKLHGSFAVLNFPEER